jgi:hypothetical protein
VATIVLLLHPAAYKEVLKMKQLFLAALPGVPCIGPWSN